MFLGFVVQWSTARRVCACILDPVFISIFNFMLYGMLERGNLSFIRRTDCTLAARDVTLSFG